MQKVVKIWKIVMIILKNQILDIIMKQVTAQINLNNFVFNSVFLKSENVARNLNLLIMS